MLCSARARSARVRRAHTHTHRNYAHMCGEWADVSPRSAVLCVCVCDADDDGCPCENDDERLHETCRDIFHFIFCVCVCVFCKYAKM